MRAMLAILRRSALAVHGYIRASTNKQHETLETQKETILRYCRFHGLIGNREPGFGPPTTEFERAHRDEPLWYSDPATSGKVPIDQREAGQVMCRALRRGDHVVIARLDRAFRKLSDCCKAMEAWERTGVKLHVCNLLGGAIDLSSPIGRFLLQILGAFAELERAFISERTSESMKARKRRGEGGGRPRYGFKHEVRTRMVDGVRKKYLVEVPDPYERRIMKMILAWRTQEVPWSWSIIREKLMLAKLKTTDGKEWSDARIRRAAKAEAVLQYREVTSGACHERSH